MSYYEEKVLRHAKNTDRYRNCKILVDKSTKDALLSTREIVDIPIRNSDIYHTLDIHEVGRLDLIAYKYYRNASLWWVIAQANDIYDPFLELPVGQLLRIPTLESLYGQSGILL